MSPIITYALVVFISLYSLVIFVELVIDRAKKKFIIEVLTLIGFVTILHLLTGFPTASTRQAFGGVGPLTAIGIMFICTIMGIAARYLFSLEGKFSLRVFLKPLFISPIVFLPLIGSVQGVAKLEAVQMISFAILSFQNGFFLEGGA